ADGGLVHPRGRTERPGNVASALRGLKRARSARTIAPGTHSWKTYAATTNSPSKRPGRTSPRRFAELALDL
ncbi:MAG TPA: hypothetical protein VHJ79_01395, partial [Mycobacterium sp.]|nr:hypothetical protein [Mycobacterium sp.]